MQTLLYWRTTPKYFLSWHPFIFTVSLIVTFIPTAFEKFKKTFPNNTFKWALGLTWIETGTRCRTFLPLSITSSFSFLSYINNKVIIHFLCTQTAWIYATIIFFWKKIYTMKGRCYILSILFISTSNQYFYIKYNIYLPSLLNRPEKYLSTERY